MEQTYAIKTNKGYFAHQHNRDWTTEKWFEKKPVGWALLSSKEDAEKIAQYFLSDTECTIEII